jgi:hypothetical protein
MMPEFLEDLGCVAIGAVALFVILVLAACVVGVIAIAAVLN